MKHRFASRLLHALPGQQVRLKALLAVEAALGATHPSDAAASAHAVLRSEDAAPLLGHTASLLLQVRADLGVLLLGGARVTCVLEGR